MKRTAPMSAADKQKLRAIQRAVAQLVTRTLGEPSSMTIAVDRHESGEQCVVVMWCAAGWTGTVNLRRPGVRMLSAKHLAGVLEVLGEIEE